MPQVLPPTAETTNHQDANGDEINFLDGFYDRGLNFLLAREYQNALCEFEEALKFYPPGEARIYNSRSCAWAGLKEYGKALDDLERALKIDPTYALALNNRASIQATCPNEQFRKVEEALASARKACEQSSWKEPQFIDTLAAAHANAGNFAEAIQWQSKALELAGVSDSPWYHRAQQRLGLYQSGVPYRDDDYSMESVRAKW